MEMTRRKFINTTGVVAKSTRREFLKESLAALGFAMLPGGWLFAAPPDWKPQKRPKIVFGVLADTHFRTDGQWRLGIKSDRYFVSALEYFRNRNVDAVVHCGDMADRGLVEELQFHADAWFRVFPQNKAPDGHVVEKLFVTGNHDAWGWRKDIDFSQFVPDRTEWPEKVIKMDVAGHWERVWGEKYEPVWHKQVKGCDFFGMNWIENDAGQGEAALLQLIDAHAPSSAPFFFITHDRTHGGFNRAIKKHPNAFGLWGHWHFSAANWGVIRMLNETTPGVQCPACPAWWRSDGKWMGGGDSGITKVPLEGKLQGGKWEQGLVVRVYDDMLTIERREFSEGGSLGADWVMPFGGGTGNGERGTGNGKHPFSKEELKKVIGEPQFRKGAKLEVSLDRIDKIENTANDNPVNPVNPVQENPASPKLCVRIPLADGNPDSRVYAYEVVVIGEAGSQKLFKAVYAAGCNMGIGHEPNGGVTTLEIAKDELPPGKTLTVAVRPLTSLGTSGQPIETKFKT